MRPSSSHANFQAVGEEGESASSMHSAAVAQASSPIYQTFPPRDSGGLSFSRADSVMPDGQTRPREDSFTRAMRAENSLFFPWDRATSPTLNSDGTWSTGETPLLAVAADRRREAGGGRRGSRRKRKKKNKGMSPLHVTLNFCKCALGVGCFALPNAYASVGLVWSIGGTLLLAVLSAYTVAILAWTELEVIEADGGDVAIAAQQMKDGLLEDGGGGGGGGRRPRIRAPRMTYPELGAKVCPGATCCGNNVMSAVIYVTLLFTSVGVCAAYVGFMGLALDPLIPQLTVTQIDLYILFPCTALLSLLRSFKYIAFTSIIGDVAVLAGFAGVVIEGFMEHELHLNTTTGLSRPEGIPEFIGTVAFCFAIHMVVLPMSQSLRPPYIVSSSSSSSRGSGGDDGGGGDDDDGMVDDGAKGGPSKTPQAQQGCCSTCLGRPKVDHKFGGVALYSYLVITVLNLAFGLLCWFLFGDNVHSNVLKDITNTTGAGLVVMSGIRVTMTVAMLFTVPMILAVGREILENNLLRLACAKQCPNTTRNLTRIGLTCTVFAMVIGIPDFKSMVSLVGGFAACLTGFILPPILWVAVRKERAGIFCKCLNYSIALFGTGLAIMSTYFTVAGIVNDHSGSN